MTCSIPGIEIDAILLEFSQERSRIWKYIADANKEVSASDSYIMTIMHNFKDEIANTIEKYRQLFEPLASPTICTIKRIHSILIFSMGSNRTNSLCKSCLQGYYWISLSITH